MKPSPYAPATARNAELSVREVTASYGELVLVEQAASQPASGQMDAKRLGVFWHTQGSGKSLSMVFFTQKVLRRVLGSCTPL